MISYIQVGKIVNTHGVKGEVKVIPLTDDSNRFKKLKNVMLETKNTVDSEVISCSRKLTVDSVKFQNEKVIVKFKEVNDMNEAEALKNMFIVIDRKEAVKLPQGRYFIFEIIGCQVVGVNGEDYGKVIDVISTGSNDIYVAQKERGKEILVPALKTIIKDIDIEKKNIIVDLPEGINGDEI